MKWAYNEGRTGVIGYECLIYYDETTGQDQYLGKQLISVVFKNKILISKKQQTSTQEYQSKFFFTRSQGFYSAESKHYRRFIELIFTRGVEDADV